MTAAVTPIVKGAYLRSFVETTGAAVVVLHGVKDGACTCKLGSLCGVKEPGGPPKNAGKHPDPSLCPNGWKSASRDPSIINQWIRARAGANFAFVMGTIKPGDPTRTLACLDIDPRNGGNETLAAIVGIRGELPVTVRHGTGGGGDHYFFWVRGVQRSRLIGPGVEVKAADGYVVAPDPNGKHWSGGVYSVRVPIGTVEIADAPEWLQDETEGVARPERLGGDTARETVLGEIFALGGKLGAHVHLDGAVDVCCPWADEHSDARGRGEDSSTVILPPAGGSRFGGFRCQHSHCTNRKWDDVLRMFDPHIVQSARDKYPLRPVEVQQASSEGSLVAKDPLQAVRLMLKYKATKAGGVVPTADIVNAITILSYDHRWKGSLSLDTFSQTVRYSEPPPWHPDDAPGTPSAVWSDGDGVRLHCWLTRNWSLDLPPDKCIQAADIVAAKQCVHPLREWLDRLKWDGTPRAAKWLHRYLGVEDDTYAQSVGTWWLVSAVARAYTPGCKADHVLILEGRQGAGKSRSLRALFGDTWFSDTPIDIGSKDGFLQLSGKWAIELAELASFMKSDDHKSKAFFSSPTDRLRKPYGRETVDIPRSCVFVGTVNHDAYFTDVTGNRRYWPVRCGVIDHENLRADAEQIWAEVVTMYRNGARWWPEGEDEHTMVAKHQKEREMEDAWTPAVAAWLKSDAARALMDRNGGWLTVNQVLLGAIEGLEEYRISHGELVRGGRALATIGWEKVRRMTNGTRVWAWRPKR